jgi:nucleoid-associated protein YgaU
MIKQLFEIVAAFLRSHVAEPSYSRSIEIVFEDRRRASMGQPVRLTRRGRAVVIVFVVACVLTALWLTAERGAFAGESEKAREVFVVQPGDTLWDIAARAKPQADPRLTLRRIMKLNHLSGVVLEPGQRLVLPR